MATATDLTAATGGNATFVVFSPLFSSSTFIPSLSLPPFRCCLRCSSGEDPSSAEVTLHKG